MSPGRVLPFATSACQAVTAAHGSVEASSIAQVLGDVHKAVLVQDDVVREHSVETAGEHRAVGFARRHVALEPALEDSGRDAVANLDAGDAGADLDDLAGGVRARQQRQLHAAWGDAVLDHRDVAVVERDRAHPNTRFSRPERRVGQLLELEPVDAERVGEPPGSHRARSAR